MSDLMTSWLGLSLKTPFVVAASPLSKDPDAIAMAVDSGAGAVIMHSLFEEQLINEQMAVHKFVDMQIDHDAESRGFLPESSMFSVDAGSYLVELENLRKRVNVPIIGSLNGTTPGGWINYAKRLECAGANAIELNLYDVTTLFTETGAEVEKRQLDVVHSVVQAVNLPVNVKLSSFYSSVPSFVHSLENVGAMGVTVFNRFYQPDISLETLDVSRKLSLSTPDELTLRLHALAILSATTNLSLSCTGGVHSGFDAAKAILCGARVVQLASVLLRYGPKQLSVIRDELIQFLNGKGYKSSCEAQGVLNHQSAPNQHAWERMNYIEILEGWHTTY
jgi:dihydroorotate dehydrogenase (fumarate)